LQKRTAQKLYSLLCATRKSGEETLQDLASQVAQGEIEECTKTKFFEERRSLFRFFKPFFVSLSAPFGANIQVRSNKTL
jgi:hypothetical protein